MISILHWSCRTSDLQFSLILQTYSPSFKRICNKEHKGVICYMTSSSNSSLSTRPTGRQLWEELLFLSRFHFLLRADEWNFCPLLPYIEKYVYTSQLTFLRSILSNFFSLQFIRCFNSRSIFTCQFIPR